MKRDSIYRRYKPGVTPIEGNSEPACWFVFGGGKLLVKVTDEKVSLPSGRSLDEFKILPVRTQYLGTLDGHPCFSAEVSPETAAPEGMAFRDLRSLYPVLDEDIFLLAGKAIQTVAWDQTHQYCGRCGKKTENLPNERAKKCPSCGFLSYPRISPATITAVLKGDKILLTHYAGRGVPFHSIVAGFLEIGETLEECVRREVLEEVGIRVKNVKYFGNQPWPFPNSLMIGFTAEWESGEIKIDEKELSEAAWYDVDSLPALAGKMSIARELIDWYIESRTNK